MRLRNKIKNREPLQKQWWISLQIQRSKGDESLKNHLNTCTRDQMTSRRADGGKATHDCRILASRIPSARLFRTESEEGPLWSETIASNMITCSLLLVPIRKKLKPSKTYPAIATASNSWNTITGNRCRHSDGSAWLIKIQFTHGTRESLCQDPEGGVNIQSSGTATLVPPLQMTLYSSCWHSFPSFFPWGFWGFDEASDYKSRGAID